ncbi:MAG TPA: tetratricopeptide repeat protein [Polyangiaceae bacterium]|nr:tetratricopeptide repeat protein [Polyangiaceae bacterium]
MNIDGVRARKGTANVRQLKIETALGTVLAALEVILLAACGGNTPPAQAPAPATAETTPTPPTTPTPTQLANLSSGPSGGDLSGEAKSSYDRGFQAWTTGDLPGASAAFRDAVAKAPSSAAARYSLGCVLERLGDSQGALDAYRAAYTANPKNHESVSAYAVLLARLGRGADAEQFLAGRLAQDPDSAALATDLAEVKSIEGDSPGCQQLAQQALSKKPDYKDAMVVIARDYYRSHRWDLARYALQAILDGAADGSIPPRDSGNPSALLLRALVERDSGQRKQAIADFEEAISRRPDLAEAYVNLGEMKLEAGNATEAELPLEKAARYSPNLAVVHLDLGDCYRLLGRTADAKRELDAALRMDSTLAGVHYNLGLLYLFSQSVPGASGEDDQLARAITELQSYKSMRGAKVAKGQGDDVDELLSTAKRKQSELQLKKQAAAAPPASGASSPSAPAAPASSGTAAPAKVH